MKRIIISSFLLYLVNLISIQFNFIIPINTINLSVVSTLGISGLVGLIVFKFLL